jgi:hypothetical protein
MKHHTEFYVSMSIGYYFFILKRNYDIICYTIYIKKGDAP